MPEAGKKIVSAMSSPANEVASPAARTEAMKTRPPDKIMRRRRGPAPLVTPIRQLKDAAHDERHRGEQPDLQVTEREVVPDQRHGRALRPVDELVD